jgi:hypothetical protein
MSAYGGPENTILEIDGGELLLQEDIEPEIRAYLEEMSLSEPVDIIYSSHAVAPTSVAYDARSCRFKLTIRTPINYRKERMTGVLNHEIGTHLIRRLNDRSQPWNN